jgi:hypothetical protein
MGGTTRGFVTAALAVAVAAGAGCERAALSDLNDGTTALTKGDYAGAEPPLAKATDRDIEKAVALENHGVALAWTGHIDDGVAELKRASLIFPVDDRIDQQQVLYEIGRAYQQTHDCQKTTAGYADYLSLAKRFPGNKENVAVAQQNIAIACNQPKAFTLLENEANGSDDSSSDDSGSSKSGSQSGSSGKGDDDDNENPLGK